MIGTRENSVFIALHVQENSNTRTRPNLSLFSIQNCRKIELPVQVITRTGIRATNHNSREKYIGLETTWSGW